MEYPKPKPRDKKPQYRLKKSSSINTFECSSGERIPKGRIDRNIRYAKEQKLREFRNDNGREYCEQCGSNQGRIDCSHIISVKYAQETGRTELSWSIPNIKLHCASCHAIIERQTNIERESIYLEINGR